MQPRSGGSSMNKILIALLLEATDGVTAWSIAAIRAMQPRLSREAEAGRLLEATHYSIQEGEYGARNTF
jgi:hypothetical protein